MMLDAARTGSRNLGRISPGPLLVRAIAFCAGLATLGLALPPTMFTAPSMVVSALLAALAAIFPRSAAVTLLLVVALGLWLGGTAVDGGEVSGLGLILLGWAMYFQHTACALAAAVPLDAVVLPSVLFRWFARTAVVMLVTAILGVVVVTLSGKIPERSSLVFPLLGVACAILIGVILAYLALRRPRDGS
ncbi:hypothetical protein [Longispora albida]|uniref:hypothetical protein n=1 Tax=Longispora albida TaxID=203523 RepID=UPI00037F45C9|nr:hypothetical protein [Longispora albida]